MIVRTEQTNKQTTRQINRQINKQKIDYGIYRQNSLYSLYFWHVEHISQTAERRSQTYIRD